MKAAARLCVPVWAPSNLSPVKCRACVRSRVHTSHRLRQRFAHRKRADQQTSIVARASTSPRVFQSAPALLEPHRHVGPLRLTVAERPVMRLCSSAMAAPPLALLLLLLVALASCISPAECGLLARAAIRGSAAFPVVYGSVLFQQRANHMHTQHSALTARSSNHRGSTVAMELTRIHCCCCCCCCCCVRALPCLPSISWSANNHSRVAFLWCRVAFSQRSHCAAFDDHRSLLSLPCQAARALPSQSRQI